MSTPRAPSSDQSAISTAPVSEAGTIPIRQPAGIRSTERVRSMTSASFALPGDERCERPSVAAESASSDHPGRLAQGPEEKFGSEGRTDGFIDFTKRKSAAPGSGAGRENAADTMDRAHGGQSGCRTGYRGSAMRGAGVEKIGRAHV